MVRKTVGLAEPLRGALSSLQGGVEVAFLYGSVAEGTDRAESDIDLMVIARELDYLVLYDALVVRPTVSLDTHLGARSPLKRGGVHE
ncbi:MAG: hypothetical protein BRD57_02625 [Proteobacteria bacterium SW_6_67_9]|nr:MAG: hypothetical protein BRD57_02625 [Proteobacteria bacterium SW_6_67_9]